MVRVFYEPPPYGPRTSLNRTPYGLGGGGLFGRNLEYWSKQRPSVAIGVPVAVGMVLAYAITSTYSKCTAIRACGSCEFFVERNE